MAVDFSVEVVIRRSPEEVFAFVTDPARLPEWDRRVVRAEAVDGRPLHAGSRIREVRRAGPRTLEQIVEVVAHEPARRFGMRIVEGPVPIHGDLVFSPAADGATRVRMHAYGRGPRGLRLLDPLLGRLAQREMRAQYRRLKAVLEAVPGGSEVSGPAQPVP